MKWLQGILLLFFLSAVGLFAVQNTQTLTVLFLKWGVTSSVAFVILGSYVLGMLSGWTVVAFVSRSIKRVRERRD
jgi:uncharacterized integral membrane protein